MRLLALGVLFCVVVASGHAASVYKSGIKREHCSWGAQYWCSSPKTAGLCKKTEWCSLHYWPYDMIEESSCTTAQQLVKNVRGFISTGDLTSDHEIALAIAKGCSVMKDDKLRHQCKGIVSTEEILKKLLHLVDSKLSSQSVAAAIGACKRSIPKELPKPCTTCVDVVTTAQKYFSKFFTLEMYNKLVEPQCTKLGQGQQLCQSFAAANYENFFNGIVSATPQEVCKYKTKCLAVSKELHRVQSDDICETCKTVVTDIRALDRDQGVQEAIRGLIKPVCAKLGEFKELCDTLADEGMEYVFEIIATEMEPDVVCAKLDLCGQSEQTKTSAKRIEISAVKEPGVAASASCIICELVMTKLDELISANSTEEELQSILDDVCNRLPGTVGQECLTFVNQYSPLIIKMLLQKLSPKLVCTALGLCKNSTGALPKQPHVQLTLKQPVKANDEICDLCDYVVKFLDAFLEKNNTEAEIEALLEKVCTILPGTLRQQCDTLVQQYGPVIIALLLSELQPDAVCAALGLCNKTRKELQMSRGHVSQSDDEVCNMCEFVVTYLDNFLNANSSEAQIEAVLDQVCNILPTSLKSECVALVKQYGPMIVKFLQQELSDPKQICTDLRLCSSAKVTLKFKPSAKKINPPSASNDQLCDLCQYVVTYLDTFLEKNTTLDEIEQLMDKVCAVLPSSVSQQCDTLVKQFGPMIIQLLLQEMQPKQVCTALKICTSKNHVSTGMVSEKPVSNDEICVLCEFLMKELDVWVSENSSVPEIEVALNKVCDLMPTTIKLECQQFVSQYTPAIIQLLVAKLAPEKVCQTLGLCSKRQVGVGSRKVKESPTCVLCEFVIKELDILISENRSLPEIEAALNKVCGLMPITIRSECQQFVNQYTPVIIQLLLSRLAPEKICQTIGLCSKMKLTVKSDAANIKQQKANDELCTVCEAVMKEVDAFLSENKTEAEIEAALDKVCDIMPASIKSQCEELLQQYAPVILQLLLQELQPQKICTAIGLCKSKVSPPTPKKANDAACVLCEFVMTKLDTILAENSTEAEIETALDTVCNLLPSSVRTQCEGLIEQYAPILLQLLLQKLKPEQLCTAIGLCKTEASMHTPKKANDAVCVLCEFVMTKLDTILAENSTEAEIEAALDTVCNLLPSSVRTQCEGLIEQYAPILLQLLLQKLKPEQLCTAIGLCKTEASMHTPKKANDAVCVLCEFVMTKLDTILAENSTEAEIEAALDTVCNLLPSSVRTQCEGLIEQYAPIFLQLLLQKLKPEVLCTAIGLCKTTESRVITSPKVGSNDTCVLCEFVMSKLDTFLAKNSTEAEIEAALDKVCDILPASIKSECEQLLEQYAPVILQLLIQKLQPKQICTAIGLCNAYQKPVTSSNRFQSMGDSQCVLCEFVLKELDSVLGKESTASEVEATLDKVCHLLPSTIRGECQTFVDEYTPFILQILVQEIQPAEVCKMLGLCKASLKALPKKPDSVSRVGKQKTVACALCEAIMQALEGVLKKNSSKAEIIATLDKVCYLLPEKYKQPCIQFLPLYTDYVVELIEKEIPPKLICGFIKICIDDEVSAVQNQVTKNSVKKGELCPLCVYVFENLDKILESKSSEDDMKAALLKVCEMLPSEAKQQCRSFVEVFLPYVVDLVLQEVPPQQICQMLELCYSTESISFSVNKLRKTPTLKKGELCYICTYVFLTLDQILPENATEMEIEKALDQVCDFIPQIKEQCENLVTLYTPYVIDFITRQFTPKQICETLGLCGNSVKKVVQLKFSPKKSEVKKGELCPLCMFVMETVDKQLEKNATKEEIIAALDKVCDILPSTIKDQCESFVGLYLPYVVDLIVKELTPEQICQELGLCNSTTTAKVPKSSDLCELCKYVIQYLDNILEENSTEAQIEQALDIVCTLVPSALKEECETFIKDNAEMIIQYLLQNLKPDLCISAGMCNNALKAGPQKLIEKHVEVTAGPECAICEYLMNYLDNLLEDNSTEQQIAAALEEVCTIVPATIRKDCVQFIASRTPQLIQMLLKVTPDQVCTYMRLCASKVIVSKPVTVGPQCPICEFVMKELDRILKKNATAEEIESALDKVCDILPSTVKQNCDQFVAQHTPALIQLLQHISPDQVCSYIGLCSTEEKDTVSKLVKSDTTCEVCVYVMKYLDSTLASNATEQEIESALDRVCNFLPASVRQECDQFVAQDTPILLQVLQELLSDQICSSIGLCSSKVKVQVAAVKGTEFCVICDYVMRYLEGFLAENATQQEIEAVLERICNLIPSSVKDECDQLISQYTPQLVQALLKFTPLEVCSSVGLCKNQGKVSVSKPVAAGPQCIICEYVMEYLEGILKENATEQEIESALERVCNFLPSTVKQECDQFVAQYTPVLIQLLQQVSPDQVCSYIGLCSSQKKESKPVKAGPQCTICEFVMKYLDGILAKNSTEQEIESALERVCNFLPSTVRQECDQFVAQYTPVLIQLLQQFSPDQVCSKIGLCSSQKKESKPVKAGPQCTICEFVMNYLDSILAKNSTEQEIESALERVCNFLPSTVRQECDQFVAQYTPVLIQLLQQFSPDQVCSKIGLCTSQKEESKPVKAGPQCTICEFVMKYLDSILAKNSTEQEIESALESVCNFLPSTVRQECDQFVSQYTPVLIQLLQQVSPDQVCSYIGLCSSQKKESKPVKAGPQCTICEFVMKYLDSILDKNSTEQEIESALESVCNFLPSTVRQECDQFVSQYTPVLIQLLQQVSPDQVCSYIGLCSSQKKESKPVKAGPQCTICEFVMKYLDSILDKNSTEQEIESALERVCNFLPSTVRQECDQFVAQYTPVLIQLLQQFSPDQVCSKIGLCTSQKEESKHVKAGPQCTICEFVMKYLDSILAKNSTEQEIESALERVCNFLPSTVRQECDQFVAQYTPVLIQLLQQFSPDQVCSKIGLCTSQKEESKHVKAGPQCTICEFVMKYLDSILAKNSTEQEIESALESVCNFLPSTVRQECDQFVSQYTPVLIQLLQQVSPDQVCSYIGLCSSQKKESKPVKAGPQCTICEFVMKYLDSILDKNSTEQEIESALERVCNFLPSTVRQECDQFVAQYTPVLIQLLQQFSPDQVCSKIGLCTSQKEESKPVKAGPQCTICEFVMKYLDSILAKNSTEQEIESALERVCNFLPSTVRQECDQFVAQYTPVLIQLLQQFSPDQVCSKIGLCTSQKEESKPVKAGPQCTICEFVMKYLDSILAKNSTEQEIESALESVCNFLPSTVRQECDQFVSQYTPVLIQLLQQVSPDQVCSYIGLCSSQKKESKPVKAGPQCTICEFVMKYLDSILDKNSTEQEIESALESVCNFLPSTVRQECDQFVSQYTPVLIQLLQQVSPDQVCSYIGLCSSQKKESKPVKAGPQCTICEFVMKYLDSILDKNSTEQEIESALERVCNFLPSTVRQECDQFVAQYTPVLIQLLQQFSPDQVCSKIGLCTSQKEESKHVKAGPQCTICEFVMKYLDSILAKNSTEQEIESALERVCNFLPSTVRQECDQFVAQYTPVLIQLLQQFSPDQVCSKIGLCTSQKEESKHVKAGPQCTICEFVMKYLDSILAKNSTEQEIESALERVCNFLPSTVRQECDQFVAQYTPVLIQLLQQFSPDQVCSKIGLCTSQKEESKPVKAGPQCTICEFVMNYLDSILAKNSTEQEIESALERVCNFLPSTVRQECDQFVAQYTPVLIQLLQQFSPDQVCSKIGLCTSQKEESKPVKAGPQCTICEFVMKYLDSILAKNSTEQEIESALERVCNFLPSTVRQECDQFVAQYTPELIQLLQQFSPDQVCSKIGLCSSQEKLTVVQKVDAGDLCVICEFVMKYLEEVLAKNATVQEIESALDKVCNVLPSTVRQECEQFVAQYTPLAIQVLEQKITPGQACTTMRLCTSEHKAKKFPIKPVQNGPTCTLCEFILETLDGFLSKNATVTEIEKALDIVCFILPSTLKTDCQQFISQYAPLIIQLLLQETRPRQVCIAAGLCTSEPSEVMSEPVEKIPGVEADELCMLCEFIATELENLLSEKATEAEIESFLDNVCHKFEGAIQDECITFVALYTPRAIAILMPLLDPKTFCSELKLCKASVKSQTPKVEGPECVLCEFVMEKLKKMLSDHATEAEIEDALKKVCDFLPSSLESECNSFIDKYGPLIIKLLLSEVTPEEICTKLGLCTSKVQSETFNLKKDTIRGCTLCKFVMEEVHGLLEEPIVAIEVEKVLDKICQKLPQKWQTPCKELAEMFSPNIVSLIASALSPISFCQEIDLCEKRHEVSGQSMVQLLGVDEKSDNPTTTAIPTTTTPPPIKPDCSGCKFAMYELQTALADPYWQTQSKTVLYTLCGYFGSHNDVCKLLIDMNLSKMISEIRAYLFPIDFCQKIQFCEPPAEVAERSNSLMFVPEGRVELEPPTLPPIPTPTPPIKPDCSTCKFALYELQTSLSNPFWDDASKTILEAFCDYMGVGADVCKLLVDLNISSLLSKIRAFRFPIEFCQKAEFCEPPAKDLAVSLGKLGSTECELCQVLVQLLDAFLQKNSTETQVETFLEDVCNTIVPEEDRPQCVSIVKEYTPILMQLLSSLDDPIKVCQSARLCLNPSPRMMYKSLRNGGN